MGEKNWVSLFILAPQIENCTPMKRTTPKEYFK